MQIEEKKKTTNSCGSTIRFLIKTQIKYIYTLFEVESRFTSHQSNAINQVITLSKLLPTCHLSSKNTMRMCNEFRNALYMMWIKTKAFRFSNPSRERIASQPHGSSMGRINSAYDCIYFRAPWNTYSTLDAY